MHGEYSEDAKASQLPSKKRPKKPIDNAAGQNLIDLSGRFDVSNYETGHSDIVALMVFEHQIDAHNLMVRTNYAFQANLAESSSAANQTKPNHLAERSGRVGGPSDVHR